MQAKEFAEARDCYSQALAANAQAQGGLLEALLLNLSASYLKLDNPGQALRYAAACMAFKGHPACVHAGHGAESASTSAGAGDGQERQPLGKACFRAASALHGLDQLRYTDFACALMQDAALYAGSSGGERKKLYSEYCSSLRTSSSGSFSSQSASSSGSSSSNCISLEAYAVLTRQVADTLAISAGGHTAAPTDTAASAAKERGNEHFKAGRYEYAVHEYSAALGSVLSSCEPQPALLLSNRAACSLQMERPQQAVPVTGAVQLGQQQQAGDAAEQHAQLDPLHGVVLDAAAALLLGPQLTPDIKVGLGW